MKIDLTSRLKRENEENEKRIKNERELKKQIESVCKDIAFNLLEI